ncbi:MAG: hypothetical protein HYY29_05510 [Chloroflexi bacterium]|nr:hypothetical protein [Chloroflexota bacterium]
MKIHLEEGNFTIRVRIEAPFTSGNGLPRKEMDLGSSSATVKHLLSELTSNYRFAGRFPVRLLDRHGSEVSHDYGVSVNGVEYELLPERLDTALKRGDEVEITMVMLGGG